MLHIYIKTNLTYLWLFSPSFMWSILGELLLWSLNYLCGHWTTSVVIELLYGQWTDCLFWTMNTKLIKQIIIKAELNLSACLPIIFLFQKKKWFMNVHVEWKFSIFDYQFTIFCYRDLSNNLVEKLVPGVFADLSSLQGL